MLREARSWLLSNAAKTLCSSFWSSELEVEHSYFPIPSHRRPGVVRYSALRVGVRIMNVTSFAEAAMMRVLGFHTVYSLKSASYKRRKREKRLEWFVWSLFFVLKPRARCQKKNVSEEKISLQAGQKLMAPYSGRDFLFRGGSDGSQASHLPVLGGTLSALM